MNSFKHYLISFAFLLPSFLYAEQRFESIVQFNEKLKTAVCDESFVSRAPTLESLGSGDDRVGAEYHFKLAKLDQLKVSEAELVSFLLGDSSVGIFSDQLASLLEKIPGGKTQETVVSSKRKLSLEICESILKPKALEALLKSSPSRFLEAEAGIPGALEKQSPGVTIELTDREGRFGKLGKKHLVPGWIESFEVDKISIHLPNSKRSYRRVANPVTNNTQFVEVLDLDGMTLGILYLSLEQPPDSWAAHKSWAENAEARSKHVEIYLQRIEHEALRAVHLRRSHPLKAEKIAKVRDLQEFYKNMLHAYQLMPNEKQFTSYGKSQSADDGSQKILGADYLKILKNAKVNTNYVHLGLFKPDPKLHAIFAEYRNRLKVLLANSSD